MSGNPHGDQPDDLRRRLRELEAEVARLHDERSEIARADALRRELVAHAPIGLGIADETGEFLSWNPALLAVAGFLPSEVGAWKAHCASETVRLTHRALVEKAKLDGGLFGHEVRVPKRDGSTSAVVATVVPIALGGERLLHVTMQDVSDLERVEGALRESELRFRQVAGTLRQVFYITSADHRECHYISPAYETLWGKTSESLYADSHSWIDSIHADDRLRVLEEVGRGPVDDSYEFEYRIVRPDGSVRWIRDRAYEMRAGYESPYRLVGVAEDITDRRRLEEQLREAQKMEAVGQLAGGVAHDFNNLLTIILANVTLLAESTSENAPEHALLEEIEHASSRARELTRKLLGFSRRVALELRPCDLRAIVRESVALLRRTLDPRIRVVVDEPAELHTVLADPGEMSQVLLNLCINARDAMPSGGTLTVRTRACAISDEHARAHVDAHTGLAVCLTVEDTGHGIASPDRARIFEPFFTTKEPGSGTGLGLAMAFGIVKQHRGWIECASEVGHGTRFDVYLPVHGSTTLAEVPRVDVSGRAQPGETILFVDDEAGIRSVAAAILGARGYEILLAEDGITAIDLFERHRGSIDLVVLDLRMPRLSGRDTLHAIWAVDPTARVLVTSGHSDDLQEVAHSEPVAGCLSKPWSAEELAHAIRATLTALPARKGSL